MKIVTLFVMAGIFGVFLLHGIGLIETETRDLLLLTIVVTGILNVAALVFGIHILEKHKTRHFPEQDGERNLKGHVQRHQLMILLAIWGTAIALSAIGFGVPAIALAAILSFVVMRMAR